VPALNGQVIMTLTGADGQPVIVATWFFDPATGLLRNGTFTTSRGGRTGALVVDNLTGRPVRVVVHDADGTELRDRAVPRNGFDATAAQMAAAGFSTLADMNGLTFDLA